MIFEAPEATSNKTPGGFCANFCLVPTNGPFSRPQKVAVAKKTRIQKRAVGILENSQTKSAIGIVEKDTVPGRHHGEGKAGCHLEGYHLEDSVEMGQETQLQKHKSCE